MSAAIPSPSSTAIHFVSLGCPKNTVDTERMAGLARRQGLRLGAAPAEAEIIVVNTCGFIEAAKQESVETILDLAQQKHDGRCRLLLVAGCLAQRYPEELARELPEVDAFIGTADLGRLAGILEQREVAAGARITVGPAEGLEEAEYARELCGPAHTAYLKISEGCNRPCAFCAIPLMRGRQRSRTIGSLVAEAEQLVARGARELILVAQDSTAYGRDLRDEEHADLAQLLAALDGVAGLHWLRVHYAYPSLVTPELAEQMARLPRVVPYLDLPIQHIDDEVLRRMRRGYGAAQVRQALANLRAAMPTVAIRSTLLVGHPGESEEAHRRLCAFVSEAEIDHLGAFVFSPEEDTAAASQSETVPTALATERRDELMTLQRTRSRRRLRRLRGKLLEVMIDGVSEESELLLTGRHAGQSPGIDGTVILADASGAPGTLVRARVEDTSDYDLVARAE
ncbi:MAG: 30S ribosomal protein S12 methylthiotransferase RimO [Proteobacteria bacterium]|nr:30S ribosomal protein S12 methylthiotransferase RimO [Pseudomonadota bacterium]